MNGGGGASSTLRRFARNTPEHRCDLCAATILEDHAHVWSERDRGLLCACGSCALLFSDSSGEVQAIMSRVEPVVDFHRGAWEKLAIPVTPACVFWRHGSEPRALFPGSFGAAEGQVEESAWRAFLERVPSLHDFGEGKEALVVHLGRSTVACRASLDLVYRLLGQVRKGSARTAVDLDRVVASLFVEGSPTPSGDFS